MSTRQLFQEAVQRVSTDNFETLALEIFRWQAAHNPIYQSFIGYLGVNPWRVESLAQVPFMPIGFFKSHRILTQSPGIEVIFESSGTTGTQTSRHYVADLEWYNTISARLFQATYGPLTDYHILGLLPSYLERNNSSLVYMVQQFIQQSHSTYSGFFLHHTEALLKILRNLIENTDERKVILWGVTFALLDLAESGYDLSFLQNTSQLIVMETGGMKGRRREMLREEVHQVLTHALYVPAVHSEYGMTELLSQAYSRGNGVFETSASMKILLRDINDPRTVFDNAQNAPRYGGINVVDLANLDSCAFIETQDLGRFVEGDSRQFEVIGRFDNSDTRGCNLLI